MDKTKIISFNERAKILQKDKFSKEKQKEIISVLNNVIAEREIRKREGNDN